MKYPVWLTFAIARIKAHKKARIDGKEIFEALPTRRNYRIASVSTGFYTMHRVDNSEPVEDIQMYRDARTGRWSYQCSCRTCERFAVCEHGEAMVLWLTFILPDAQCASNAPPPNDGGRAYAITRPVLETFPDPTCEETVWKQGFIPFVPPSGQIGGHAVDDEERNYETAW